MSEDRLSAPGEPNRITQLLHDWQAGSGAAAEELAPLVYTELRRLAAGKLRGERDRHTLQPTALVNEAWLKLAGQHAPWQNRAHFFAIAAQAMRRILVDRARRREAQRRNAGTADAPLDPLLDLLPAPMPGRRLIALDEALTNLADIDPRQARVVELRYFAGMSVPDTARVLGVSPMTVKREWAMARAWLFAAIEEHDA